MTSPPQNRRNLTQIGNWPRTSLHKSQKRSRSTMSILDLLEQRFFRQLFRNRSVGNHRSLTLNNAQIGARPKNGRHEVERPEVVPRSGSTTRKKRGRRRRRTRPAPTIAGRRFTVTAPGFLSFVNSCFKKHRNKEQLKAQNVTINNVEYSKMHSPPLKNKGKSCLPLSSNQSSPRKRKNN